MKTPNWPVGIVLRLQSISEVTEVNVPSSVVIGLGSLVWTTLTCQPDPASGLTTAIGWSRGNWMRSPVTGAASDSLGTRKVRITSLVPWGSD